MKYLVTTTDNKYFNWQLLVQYNNFKKLGIEEDLVWVFSFENKPSNEIINMIKHLKVKAYGILDTRKHKEYTSSVRPFILSELYNQCPEFNDETIFYCDPDMLFKSKFSTAKLLKNDTWYVSDTKSYIDSNYIKGKSEKLFNEMCDIVGIDTDVVSSNDGNAGGAQYIIKNINSEFWKKVYVDSEKLYVHMRNTSGKYSPEHPIQAWTADMWALLWNAWLFGHETKIIKRMNFSWATDSMEKVENECIYHNAGVTKEKNLFNKTKFTTVTPFNTNFSYVDENKGSKYYVNEILDTKNNFNSLTKII